MTTGWKLARECRERLLEQHPARYAEAVADHVTFRSGDRERDDEVPDAVSEAAIVGRADDDHGVEAYVVAIEGSTSRPDGGPWHLTWSLAPGREAKESNTVIAERSWSRLAPIPLTLVPARW